LRVPLDPVAHEGFTAARAYDLGRPSYAPAAIERLLLELGLGRSSRVLDLAAGTGQLSRLLVSRVGSVVAVEPSSPMREMLVEQVPTVNVMAGAAERIPLEERSVDAVFVGEAFHWFEGDSAVREITRVLRPGGGLALLWNVALSTDPPWAEDLEQVIERHRVAAVSKNRRYNSGAWRRALERTDLLAPLCSSSAKHVQQLDANRFVAQIASWSYIASLPDGSRREVLELARAVAPRSSAIAFRTDFYWTLKR
jgi:ubiquinone/menaquinone biosynthesis C-methylase UbiE